MVELGDGERIFGMEVLLDGKILFLTEVFSTAFNEDLPTVGRLNEDGSLDVSFGTNGTTPIQADVAFEQFELTVDDQNRPLVLIPTTDQLEIVRLTPNGSLDNDFDFDGRAIIDVGVEQEFPRGVMVRPDGKIVVVMKYDGNHAAAQLTSNGSLDVSFGSGGTVAHTFVGDSQGIVGMELQADGKILICGSTEFTWGRPMSLVRLNADGSVDNTFDDDGIKHRLIGGEDLAYAVHAYADGKILIAGQANYGSEDIRGALAAFNEDGSAYDMFGNSDIRTLNLSGNVDWFTAMKVQSDGKILAAGYFDWNQGGNNEPFWVVRFNTDGTLDPTFSTDGSVTVTLTGFQVLGTELSLTASGDIIVGARIVSPTSDGLSFLKLRSGVGSYIDERNAIDLNVYPNPTSETLVVNLSQLTGDNTEVAIVDAMGRTVLSSYQVSGSTVTMDISELPEGMYFGTVNSETELGKFQFVKN